MKPQLKSGLRWTCEAADLVYCAMCACVTWICLDYSITANPATVQVEDDSPQSRHPSSINFFSSVVVLLCRERGWLRKKKGTWAFWYYTRLFLVCTMISIFLKISLIFFIHSVQLIYSELVKKSIISCSLYWGFFFSSDWYSWDTIKWWDTYFIDLKIRFLAMKCIIFLQRSCYESF